VSHPGYSAIEIPLDAASGGAVQVVEWRVADGEHVAAGDVVAVVRTTTAAVELRAPAAGYAFRLAESVLEMRAGSAVAVVAQTADRPTVGGIAASAPAAREQVFTAKARALLALHGLTEEPFAHLAEVRSTDVEEYVRARGQPGPTAAPRRFADEELDPDADWDALLASDRYLELTELLTLLRKRMKARYNRHVPTGDLLHDRWELGREYGFGEGTNVYDDCLILGDVAMGRMCWVGPGCILDGSGGLTVGDYVDVSAGVHLYSHNTVERALTGHQAPTFLKATRVGSRCFLGPRSILGPGTVIGDECFVAAHSYVQGVFPSNSFISGNPAKRAGTIVVANGRARIRPFDAH
jgi:acetyltransferase-like isoleucine patch superfamily enzyme